MREAALIAAREEILLDDDRMEEEKEDVQLTTGHFMKATECIKSSISEKDRSYYERLRTKIQK